MPQTQGGRHRRRRRELKKEIEEILVFTARDSQNEQDVHVCEEILEAWECWISTSGEYKTKCKLFKTDKNEHVCAIMHEATCSATVDNLPALWPMTDECGANTVQLECSHVFYAPALAFHFLVQDMRCPVCRCGSNEQMQLANVPVSVRDEYAAKMQALQQNTLNEELTNITPTQISTVLSELQLEMCIITKQGNFPVSNARTRFVFGEQHVQHIFESLRSTTINAQIPMTTNFAVHRSFQRLVQSIIARHFFVNAEDHMMCFSITHPLLPVSFRSKQLGISQAWLAFFAAEAPAVLSLFCNSVAGSEPVGLVRSAFCQSSSTCSITVDMNMHIIINILTYVNEVLATIRNSVEQHLSLELPVLSVLHAEATGVAQAADYTAAEAGNNPLDAVENYAEISIVYGLPE